MLKAGADDCVGRTFLLLLTNSSTSVDCRLKTSYSICYVFFKLVPRFSRVIFPSVGAYSVCTEGGLLSVVNEK